MIDTYKSEYITSAFLVYACTSDSAVNQQIAADCDSLGKLCNRADKPEMSTFISPAIAMTNNFVIGINSRNKEPKKTVRLRNKIETLLDIYEKTHEPQPGKVYLVGFGPGNPELMTIKAHKLLFDADVILYDDLLDSNILEKYDGLKVYVGKRRDNHAKEQDEINEELVKYALEGKMVVRLKGGDPFIFGRGGEEKMYLESKGITVEVVPGITAGVAAAALASVPLTHRGVSSSVAFCTAHRGNSFKILEADTSVYYMGVENIVEIAKKYLEKGYPSDFPVAIVRNVSLHDQEITKTNIGILARNELSFTSPIVSIFGYTAQCFPSTSIKE
jgi:uroporphyrin-III C-methyltransferase/precorrin-2 dehydrogenase/sirohydrochlorin ferrochelatase